MDYQVGLLTIQSPKINRKRICLENMKFLQILIELRKLG